MTWNERKFVNDVLAQNVKDVLAQNVNDVMLDRACAPYRLYHFKSNFQHILFPFAVILNRRPRTSAARLHMSIRSRKISK